MRKTKKTQGNSNLLLFLVFGVIVFFVYRNYDGISPFPNPLPTPNQALDEYTSSVIQSINDVTEEEIGKVAENYKKVADEIETLSNPLSKSDLKRPQDAINKVNKLNKESLGENYSKWEPFFKKIAEYLDLDDKKDDPIHGDRTIFCVGEYFKLIHSGLQLHSINPEDLYTLPTVNLNDSVKLVQTAQIEAENKQVESEDIESKYENGEIVGALIDDPSQPEWARELAREGDQEFSASVQDNELILPKDFLGAGAGKRAVYWNYALRFDNDPLPIFGIKQITGNCVEASLGDVGMTHLLGVSIFLLKKPYKFEGPGSSIFYAWRGHCGQGMSLGKAATAHGNYGFAVRKEYLDGKYDLRDTITDQKLGMNNCRNPGSTLADFWKEAQKTPVGKITKFEQDVNIAMDILYAGGIIHTGSTSTANKDGNPVSSLGRVGAHAQTCIGYDDTQEFKNFYKEHTGKTLNEPVFMFDQTWGDTQYIKSNFPYDLWGKPTRGMFVLKWSDAKALMNNSGCYAYLPDLKGVTIEKLNWMVNK